MSRRVTVIRTDVSVECIASIISMVYKLLFKVPSSLILSPLMNEKIRCKIWGFHCGDYEEFRLLECYTMWFL
jgi:hypothetical protein